jgi:predicted component of type VI protein secretion system
VLPGLGIFGTVLTVRKRQPITQQVILRVSAFCLVLFVTLIAVGCGGSSKSMPPPSQVNVMVTGTSGALTHSSAVSITIN